MDFPRVDTFLTDIAKAIGLERSQVGLRRRRQGDRSGLCVINGSNDSWLLQPDKDGGSSAYYEVFRTDTTKPYTDQITHWCLVGMIGCCAFCISTGAYVYEPYRKKGVNILCNRFRQDIARDAGYTALLCTDVDHNTAERRTLAKERWQDIFEVINRRTHNKVHISVKLL